MKNAGVNKQTVLITNVWLTGYSGSVLNCLSLAKALKAMGYAVEVAAFRYGNPAAEHFKAAGIEVKRLPEDSLSREHYDIIWAHHAIVLDYILFSLEVTADKLIASSLSPFDPYEYLPFYADECSLCLANSVETRTQAILEGVNQEKVRVFPNYVEKDWYDHFSGRDFPEEPRKIAIVSNHVPMDLMDAVQILKKRGVAVDIYGEGHKVALIEPKILNQYDLIISIGKTVQFSMALRLPVYCYDRFGGPGYLTEENLEKAARNNFSGRGFDQKKAKVLADDIMTGYAANKNMLPVLLQYTKENCTLEDNIRKVLDILDTSPVLDCDAIRKQYARCIRHSKANAAMFFKNERIEKSKGWRFVSSLRKIANSLNGLKKKLRKRK